MKHPHPFMPLAFAAVALMLTVAPELHAQSSDMPKLPGQASGASSSGSAAATQPPAPVAAPTTPVVAGPTLPAPANAATPTAVAPKAAVPKVAATAPAEQKFEYWTASKATVRVYPQPSARSSFMRDEYYVIEQAIKVLDTVPGGNVLPWLTVLTPSNKIGYVFSGEARPANVSRSGKPVQSINSDD